MNNNKNELGKEDDKENSNKGIKCNEYYNGNKGVNGSINVKN